MGLGPLPEQNIPPAVCVGLDFLEFPVLGKCPAFIHRGKPVRVGQVLVVVDELVAQSPQNVLEVPLVDEQRYRVRLGVVVPGADERVEQVDLFIVHLDIWGWVDLHAVLAVEFQDFLYVVVEAHRKYLLHPHGLNPTFFTRSSTLPKISKSFSLNHCELTTPSFRNESRYWTQPSESTDIWVTHRTMSCLFSLMWSPILNFVGFPFTDTRILSNCFFKTVISELCRP